MPPPAKIPSQMEAALRYMLQGRVQKRICGDVTKKNTW